MKQPSKKIDWSIVEENNEWQAGLQGAPVETRREVPATLIHHPCMESPKLDPFRD